ncbi:MAG: hypothetical protein NTZ08_08655, partial [Verrucomicrobia bacterium]|nr:hypothetical protein [Verrucomicrobiota bacterium]
MGDIQLGKQGAGTLGPRRGESAELLRERLKLGQRTGGVARTPEFIGGVEVGRCCLFHRLDSRHLNG